MGFIEDVVSSVIEKLASRTKARTLMSGLFAAARSGDGGAAEKLLSIIRKYHNLGDTKIVPLTERGALGQFNTDVRIELNPYANKKMMESGVIKEPWVVASKQQKAYDHVTKANAVVDPDKTVQTGDFIGKKILQDTQTASGNSLGFAPIVADEASGITYSPFMLSRGDAKDIFMKDRKELADHFTPEAFQKIEKFPQDKVEAMMAKGKNQIIHKALKDRNVADYMPAHSEGLSKFRDAVNEYNKTSESPIIPGDPDPYANRLVGDIHDENVLFKHQKGTKQREVMDKVMPGEADLQTQIIDFSTPKKDEWYDMAARLTAGDDPFKAEKLRQTADNERIPNPNRNSQHKKGYSHS